MKLINLLKTFWSKYLFYENELLSLSNYIAIDEINFQTYSFKLEHLLLGICSEFDRIMRYYTNLNGSNTNIEDYRKKCLKKNTSIYNAEIRLQYNNICIKPLEQWNNDCEKHNLVFWDAYNNIKHNKNGAEKSANLMAVLYGLAALYYVNKICLDDEFLNDNTNFTSQPDLDSKLFYTNNLKIKCRLDRKDNRVIVKEIGNGIIEVEEKYDCN